MDLPWPHDNHFAGLACTGELLARPPLSPWDVEATVEHFAIVSYAVPPERVRPHVHPAFDLDCFPGPDGEPLVWVSMVPCQVQDFRFVAARWLRFRFGQTDYRLGLVPYAEQMRPHSVLLKHRTEFTIYLPPRRLTVPVLRPGTPR